MDFGTSLPVSNPVFVIKLITLSSLLTCELQSFTVKWECYTSKAWFWGVILAEL